MNNQTGKWFCAVISSAHYAKGEKKVKQEIKKVLGDCYLDCEIVSLDDEDPYAFIKCTEYNHGKQLIQCRTIISVLPNSTSPSFLTENEVKDFIKSTNKNKKAAFNEGDLVSVNSGLLARLNGIVIKDVDDKNSVVLFRTYGRVINQEIENDNLTYVGSIFSYIEKEQWNAEQVYKNSEKCEYRDRRKGRALSDTNTRTDSESSASS